MIKKIFVFVVIFLLCLVPLGASFAYADSTSDGVFSSSRYYCTAVEAVYRVNNTDTYYAWRSADLDFRFQYDFGLKRFYPTMYVDNVPRDNIYVQSIDSFSSSYVGYGYTDKKQGFITYEHPYLVNDIVGEYPPYPTYTGYIGNYFYFYNDCDVSDSSFTQVTITVGDRSIVPSFILNQQLYIYYTNSNFFGFFGSIFSNILSYRLYDFLTDNNNHFYIAIPVDDNYYRSTIYYFSTPSSDFNTGYDVGYSDGYSDGASSSSSSVYNTGYDIGYQSGYAVGRSTGYSEAIESGAGDNTFVGLISSVIDVPLNVLKGLFDFNILGVNLLQFFYSLFTVLLLIFVIKTLIR